MATLTQPGKSRKGVKPKRARRTRSGTSLELGSESPVALSRSTSLNTLGARIPQRIRMIPTSGPRAHARIGIELPEGTVVRLLVLNERSDAVETLVDGWLPSGAHELCNLCLPNGAYKLRLETPTTWYVAGIMIG